MELNKRKKSKKISVPASSKSWQEVYGSSKEFLNSLGAEKKDILDVLLSIEEIFVNIYKYAYPNSSGDVLINIDYICPENNLIVLFEDEGIPFDPTSKADPDITLPAEKRKIGGLGIYMVKKQTDLMDYEYKGNKNRLKIHKKLKTGGEQK